VYRTFAEGQARSRSFMGHAHGDKLSPTGHIHAAEQRASVTLCGLPTRDLYEFGRSRYPYEATPLKLRCGTCNERAGSPIDEQGAEFGLPFVE
jgi:hypothetical protein